jgi:chromosome condensin MukBEF MukE localization factor
MTELTDVMPTAAIQALAGEVIRNMESTDQDGRPVKPFQLDRCHALRTDGPAVARYYPRWTRATQDIPETDPNAQRPA